MKYDYGDDVVFGEEDQNGGVLAKHGAVVGITPIETAEQSRVFAHPVGTVLYTIEFGDGSDALIPEDQLRALSPEDDSRTIDST